MEKPAQLSRCRAPDAGKAGADGCRSPDAFGLGDGRTSVWENRTVLPLPSKRETERVVLPEGRGIPFWEDERGVATVTRSTTCDLYVRKETYMSHPKAFKKTKISKTRTLQQVW